MANYGALINGVWHSDGLEKLPVLDPSTGENTGEIYLCKEREANRALEAASAALDVWQCKPIAERESCILKFRDILLAHKKEIVDMVIKETGKVRGNAEYDFTMLVDCLPFHLEEVKRQYGAVIPSPDNSTLSYTRYTAVGVVVCVLTWNFPLLNLGYKLGPILASGCTCVIKPSEETPLATSMALSYLAEAGIPPGVVNVVNGTGLDLVKPLCESKIPRLLTTIGSTVMGKRMIGYGATTIKRFSLELGGDAPVIVFPDADLKSAIPDIVGLKFANGGQICVSPNRVFVHEDIYEAFLQEASNLAAKYSYGSGDDHAGKDEVLQPVVSQASLDRLKEMVSNATSKGARVIFGGKAVDRPGFFLEPTILADVTDEMSCQSCEIFGPILGVRSFKDTDKVFADANNSEMGLSSYVYTSDLNTALRAENELMTGNVCINAVHYSIELPHGGVKQSGYGKDISHLSLRDYFDVRRVSIKRKHSSL
eukprot:m.40276 g.40276  ORF g.40276 m.40276 type:complete len:482 (-) comp9644_c0_seq1:46-1491(-)